MGATKKMNEQEQQQRIEEFINSMEIPTINTEGMEPQFKKTVEAIRKIWDEAFVLMAKTAKLPF